MQQIYGEDYGNVLRRKLRIKLATLIYGEIYLFKT